MEKLREAKYTKWVDYYNNNYKKALSNCNVSFETTPNNKMIELINEAYSSAIDTLRIYLRNNGLFKATSLDVIKESFYIDFIDDGEDWIEIFNLIENNILYEMNGKYYLQSSNMPFNNILEYASVTKNPKLLEARLKEYGNILINENALQIVSKYFDKKRKRK